MRPLKPTLCIIGGGELEGSLRSRVDREGLDDQATFCGEPDRTEALQTAASCRILVLPSVAEGHPIVLIEAMHLGLPAAASDVTGSNEVIVDGETGYLVPASDVAVYADRLTRLLVDPTLRNRMGGNARRQVKTPEYSPSKMLAEHLAIYAESRGRSRHVFANTGD
jgi:glycosyltransferase involved in cell wall biosynthesis